MLLYCCQDCAICLDEHVIGSTSCKLNCGHLFHEDCLRGWLIKQATCPLCKYEVETDDANYEECRKERMKERYSNTLSHLTKLTYYYYIMFLVVL